MKKQTKALFTILVVVLILAGVFQSVLSKKTNLGESSFLSQVPFIFNNAPSSTPIPTPSGISVIVDFGDSNKITERVSGQTAYQVLTEAAKMKNLEVETKDYKYGKMVERIGDRTADKNNFWLYSVNGKAGQIAADKYVVYPGDLVEWKFNKI